MTGQELYSALKPFHFADRLGEIAGGGCPAPVHVRIKPTNRCNHDCWYCAYRAEELQLGEDMDDTDSIPPAKMMEIVDDLLEMDVRAVTFSGGGEPTLYKPLPDVINRLGAGGIAIGCLTNGSNLKGRVAEALARHATWVRVSIDAWDDASYAAARGIKGDAYSRMLANVQAFVRDAPDCTLGVSFIIGEKNHRRVDEVCRSFKSLGVRHVKLSAAVVSNDLAANDAYHAPMREAVAAEITRARAHEDADFHVIDHYHALGDRFEKSYTHCPSARLLTIIGADQMVYACQDKAYTDGGRLGEINDQSFKTFWFSEQNRQRLAAIDPRSDCRHHCVGDAKNRALADFLDLDRRHVAFV